MLLLFVPPLAGSTFRAVEKIDQLVDLLLLVGRISGRDRARHAFGCMVAKDFVLSTRKRHAHGLDLVQDVDAVAVLRHHARYALHLAGNPVEASNFRFSAFRIHSRRYPIWVCQKPPSAKDVPRSPTYGIIRSPCDLAGPPSANARYDGPMFSTRPAIEGNCPTMRHLCAALLILFAAISASGAASSAATATPLVKLALGQVDQMSGCTECVDMDSIADTCKMVCVASSVALPIRGSELPLPERSPTPAMSDRGMPDRTGPPEHHPPR